MDIELSILSRELILVLLLCKDLKLDFKEAKKLYLGNDKIFWRYIFFLFPVVKMTEDRFSRLCKLSSTIYDKIINDNIPISVKDISNYEYVRRHIKNRFENSGNLYEFKDFINYINNNKNGYIKRKVNIGILFYNGDYLLNASEYDLNCYKDKIYKVVIEENGEKLIFTKTSEYSFVTGDKEEIQNLKISPIFKMSNKIDIFKKEDLISIMKEDNLTTNKDLVINCDIDLDINIKCNNIYSEYNICIGNLEALNAKLNNIIVKSIKVANLDCKDIKARSIEASNKIKANNIEYYSTCFSYNNIECKSIKGTRINSKHFSLDGEVIINE